MNDYYNKLRSPHWQKKRLEIMHRDEFACISCGNKERTLNVHHKTYRKNADPWDYANENFITCCEFCHAAIHNHIDQIKMNLKNEFQAMVFACLSQVQDFDYLEKMNVMRLISNGSFENCDDGCYEDRLKMLEDLVIFLNSKLKSYKKNIKK